MGSSPVGKIKGRLPYFITISTLSNESKTTPIPDVVFALADLSN
jgi:hypothetical protein